MKEKVKILIEGGRHYHKEVHNGAEYISVGFMAKTYGMGCPCDNEEEIRSAIEHARKTIIKAGDKPIVEDTRTIVGLSKWM